MANKVRVRVELKALPHQDRDQAIRAMRALFKRRCEDYGIVADYKEHQYFESKPEKDRKKRKKAELNRLKEEAYARRSGQNRKDQDQDKKYHKNK